VGANAAVTEPHSVAWHSVRQITVTDLSTNIIATKQRSLALEKIIEHQQTA